MKQEEEQGDKAAQAGHGDTAGCGFVGAPPSAPAKRGDQDFCTDPKKLDQKSNDLEVGTFFLMRQPLF